MASVTVAHRPELTVENATEAFEEHFKDKYEVDGTSTIGQLQRILITKSKWTGVQINLMQTRDKTSFGFRGFMPSWVSRIPLAGQIVTLFLKSSWKEMEDEVGTFIENAAAFK